MWPLAIVAGIVASAVAWLLAERCSRVGWQVAGLVASQDPAARAVQALFLDTLR
jgi:hypothetical protein